MDSLIRLPTKDIGIRMDTSSDTIVMKLATKNPRIVDYLRELMNCRGQPAKLIDNECFSFEKGDYKTSRDIERLYYWILFERLGIKLDEKRELPATVGTQRRHLVWDVCSEILSTTCADISTILPWFRFLISTPRKITMKTLSRALAAWKIMKIMNQHESVQKQWMSSDTDEKRLAAYEAIAICDV